MRILEAKQVGTLYYMVPSLEVLTNILSTGMIHASEKAEYNPITKNKQHSVSFSRQPRQSELNSQKWKYGVKIDGDKLSNKYSIEPYSKVGTDINRLRVLYLIEYDDGTCVLNLVGWTTRIISKRLFDSIEKLILSQSDKYNSEHKLEISTGKRPYKGKRAVKKYMYRVPHGGVKLTSEQAAIIAEPQFNEAEERIWLTTSPTIDITGCIIGYVLPKNLDDENESTIEIFKDVIRKL